MTLRDKRRQSPQHQSPPALGSPIIRDTLYILISTVPSFSPQKGVHDQRKGYKAKKRAYIRTKKGTAIQEFFSSVFVCSEAHLCSNNK
jgi:hypothetical protein